MSRDVVITGMGAVSALGVGCETLWSAVAEGRCGIDTIRRFPTDEFTVHTGALVPTHAAPAEPSCELVARLCHEFAVAAAREALRDARVDVSAQRTRIGLVFGTGLADREAPVHVIAEEIAKEVGIAGAVLTVSTACSSSTGAIGLARDLLAMGACDLVVAGGADVVTPEVFAGFHALGVLSSGRCAPFSTPCGTSLGEGAGFFILERQSDARDRGARVHARLAGCGSSADAWHETSPDPKGAGIERAIRSALCDANLDPACIGYVNAHGSGTQANDSAEWLGIRRAVGARDVPVSSTKGALGHAQGAAGVLEAIVTIAAMQRGVVPPTLNFVEPRPHAPADPIGQRLPRVATYDAAVSVNAAFGGANAAVLFTRNGASTPRIRRTVTVRGLGRVGSRSVDIETILPGTDVRGLDPSAQMLVASAALAIRDAGITLRGTTRDAAGLLVGQRRASPASLTAFQESITSRGLSQLSATAFARIVLNFAAGACAKLLSLRGPHSAITTGGGSGLVAIAMAAELLATRRDVSLMVSGGVEERLESSAGCEGAACVLLAAADHDAHLATPGIEISGWGIAAPGDLASAEYLATHDDLPDDALVIRCDDPSAIGAAYAFADAVHGLRNGERRTALVSADGGTLAVALLLTNSE